MLEMGQHFETAAQTGARARASRFAPTRDGHFVADGAGERRATCASWSIPAPRWSRSRARTRSASASTTARATQGYSDRRRRRRVPTWRVKLDSVTVGDITLYNVEGAVHEARASTTALLGMSFLSRTEMRRDGQNLTLTKRY